MSRGTRCPVCKQKRTMWEQTIWTGATLVRVPALLYQRRYQGETEYISPRCYDCYDKAETAGNQDGA